ncbi:MAG: hypothetical protein GXX02_04140 [Syntrophomonadaceae bacterium]|nr:hypothetical protein [Syntrophomonadaceae bacterium]
MAGGRTVEQKQELAADLTREVVRILDVKPEWITVIIDEHPRNNLLAIIPAAANGFNII